mmetsp:Transcript_26971/g.27343  ORF Transcript_26971/g.27343 Transcript_26971/m.27343 type:complete len:166 (-) Transcript_26971:368-865(-)
MYSDDLRWRIVSLIHIYDVEIPFLSDIFGPKPRSIQRWCNKFLRTGTVLDNVPNLKESRWPPEVVLDVEKYVKAHPTFYIEELQQHLRSDFPDLKNTSDSTICRALNFDLQLTRKKLTKAAREAAPESGESYWEWSCRDVILDLPKIIRMAMKYARLKNIANGKT